MTTLSLKVIALFKLVRGLMALSLALGCWWGSADTLQALTSLPDWLRQITEHQLIELAILFLILALIRFIEAVGIWFHQAWAQRLAIMTGIVGVIFFTQKLFNHFDGVTLSILMVNIGIVFYLWGLLRDREKSAKLVRTK